jgi:hypothetical protein
MRKSIKGEALAANFFNVAQKSKDLFFGCKGENVNHWHGEDLIGNSLTGWKLLRHVNFKSSEKSTRPSPDTSVRRSMPSE